MSWAKRGGPLGKVGSVGGAPKWVDEAEKESFWGSFHLPTTNMHNPKHCVIGRGLYFSTNKNDFLEGMYFQLVICHQGFGGAKGESLNQRCGETK